MGTYKILAILICAGAAVFGTASGILYINDCWKAYLARKKGGEEAARKLAGRESRAIGLFMLVMVGTVVLGITTAPRRQPGPAPRLVVVAPPLTAAGLALLVGIGGAAMLLTWATIVLSNRTKGTKRATIEEARKPRRTSPWIWLYFVAIILGSIFLRAASKPGGGWGSLEGARPFAWLALIGGTGAGFAGCIIFLMVRYRDREVAQMIQRAQDGDPDGAIVDLRALINVKGPSVARANALGVLLATQGQWEEADHWFAEVGRLAGRPPWLLASRAVTLGKLGRGEEALGLLDEARAREPTNLLVATNTCHVLAGLGRFDEAREALRYAEEVRGNTYVLGASNRAQHNHLIDECRRLLPDAPPPKEPLELDEL